MNGMYYPMPRSPKLGIWYFFCCCEDIFGNFYLGSDSSVAFFFFFLLFAVGGPLKFPDLTDSFLETQKNLSEVLLCKLQQELGGE